MSVVCPSKHKLILHWKRVAEKAKHQGPTVERKLTELQLGTSQLRLLPRVTKPKRE
jgi:hypothetical protein